MCVIWLPQQLTLLVTVYKIDVIDFKEKLGNAGFPREPSHRQNVGFVWKALPEIGFRYGTNNLLNKKDAQIYWIR
jgi:hypothetical protein